MQNHAQQLFHHGKHLAEVQQADGKGQHRDRQHPVLQLEQHGNLHKDQPKVQQHPGGVKVDLQQPVGGVSTQQENNQQGDETCHRNAPWPKPADEQKVQNQINHGTYQHGVERTGGPLVYHIHAVQEVVQAGAHGSQCQERHKLPAKEVILAENVHHGLAQPDDACHTAEHDRRIYPEHLAEERRTLGFLCHSRKLPCLSIRGTILFALVMLTIGGFNVFTSIKMITGGEPGHQTDVILTWMYHKAFSTGKFGYAAALSFITTVVLAILAVIQFKLMQQKDQ